MDDIFYMKLHSGTTCVSDGFGFGREINTHRGSSKLQVSRLSPSSEDYGEIFGSFHGSRASSIPIINIPAVDTAEIFSNIGTSDEHGEVFRGLDGLDFEIPHDDDDSIIDSWTPVGEERPSGGSNAVKITHVSQFEQSGDKKPPLQLQRTTI